jgi:hypothetical protein
MRYGADRLARCEAKNGKVRKKQAPQCCTAFKAYFSTQLTDGLRWTLDHCCIDDARRRLLYGSPTDYAGRSIAAASTTDFDCFHRRTGISTSAHCAHLTAAGWWCARCAQPASTPPRTKFHARSCWPAGHIHRIMGLQVKTNKSREFRFCASETVTMQQVCTGVHTLTIPVDFFCKTVFLGCMGRMVAIGRPRPARFWCQRPAGSMDADGSLIVHTCAHLVSWG